MRNLLTKNRSGFTLVELLIVVAILGVLATVGVPTYRKMVQKSKRAEAKVNLGNVGLVESAFYSEYGAYGNNLLGMGFEIEGSGAALTYVVGFMTAGACGDPTVQPPSTNAQFGQRIALSQPSYYNQAQYRFGKTGITACPAIPAIPPECVATGPTIPLVTIPGNTAYNVYDKNIRDQANDCVITSAAVFSGYQAGAIGCVQQGKDPLTCGANVDMDIWTINDQRTLANVQDGVK